MSRKTTSAAPVKTTAPNPMVQLQLNSKFVNHTRQVYHYWSELLSVGSPRLGCLIIVIFVVAGRDAALNSDTSHHQFPTLKNKQEGTKPQARLTQYVFNIFSQPQWRVALLFPFHDYLPITELLSRSILFMTRTMGTGPHSFSTFSFHHRTFSNDSLSVVEKAKRQK